MKKSTLHTYYNYSIILCYVVFALFIGGFIYILWRPFEAQFFSFFLETDLYNFLNLMRQSTLATTAFFPRWLIFSLPNGLWAFAYSLIITTIWSESKSKIKYFWAMSVPALVLGFELLQYTETIQGTFCQQDIVFGLAGIISGYLLGNKIIKSKNHEKESI